MKKQKRQLIILLIILLVCVAAYCAAGVYADQKEAEEAAAEAEYEVLSFDSAEVVQLEINGSAGTLLLGYDGSDWTFVNDIYAEMAALNGTEVTVSASDDGEEEASSDEADIEETEGTESDAAETAAEEETTEVEYEVNSTTANTILGYLEDLTSEYQITPEEDLSAYGLEDPSMTILVTMEDGTVYRLVFGDWNEMLSGYYYYVNDADTLYTIGSYTYNILNKSDTDLADEVETEEEEEADAEESVEEEQEEDGEESAEETQEEDGEETAEETQEEDGEETAEEAQEEAEEESAEVTQEEGAEETAEEAQEEDGEETTEEAQTEEDE